jgi:hypothetical protein
MKGNFLSFFHFMSRMKMRHFFFHLGFVYPKQDWFILI